MSASRDISQLIKFTVALILTHVQDRRLIPEIRRFTFFCAHRRAVSQIDRHIRS